MENLLQDLKFSLRTLRKNPGFAAIAILTLALGIGANSAIFSLIDGIILRPLPYPHAEQLVSVTGTYPRGAFVAIRQQIRTLEMAAYSVGHQYNVTGRGEPFRLDTVLVSAELMTVLGVRAELGRTFRAGDDGQGFDTGVVLSHALWERRFAGDPSIVGRPVEIDGVTRQVLGVMPAEFTFPSSRTEAWIPLHYDPREHRQLLGR